METPFVINTNATQRDMVNNLCCQLDELEDSLYVMAVAAHSDAIPEAAVLAAHRKVQSIRQLADVVTKTETETNGTKKAPGGKVVDFIDRKLNYLNSSLMMFQSDQRLEADGGDPVNEPARADALMGAIESLEEIRTAWRKYQGVPS